MLPVEDRLHQAIALLQAQREVLGEDVVTLALAPLRERLVQEQGDAGTARQLRQVSVLFCDVVGSTQLSQHLSPEAIHAVMDGALAGFTRITQAHGGVVLQYAGDSLLAVWGATNAHEGDAASAVRAALAVLGEARAQSAAVQRQHGHAGFGVRAGIATGSALLGGGVNAERSIRGITVNIAARLEQAAPPGALRVCAHTWRLVRGQFEGDEQPPLPLKGLDSALPSWLVRGPRSDATVHALRGVEGVATPCIGRGAELQVLQRSFAALLEPASPQLQAVLVVAEPGIGKSRLAREFRQWAESQPSGARWLGAAAGEHDAGRPYGLLRQWFAGHAGLRDTDAPEVARRHWLHAMAPLLRSQADAAVLGHLLGLDFANHAEVASLQGEARQLRDRAFFHAAQALRAMTRAPTSTSALVLLIDDLHWADPGTLDFLEFLQQRHADTPLLLLALARPEISLLRPSWLHSGSWRWLELAALADRDADTLAAALLQRLPEAAGTALSERLAPLAGGNPFFLEELVNMLIDRGDIAVADGHWALAADSLHSLTLPNTLSGVLQARLDHLSPEQARLLQGAAVVGAVFWDDALRTLGLDPGPALQGLVQRQLVLPAAGSRLEGRREYAFRHHLLHRFCYDRQLQRDLVPAHAKLALWLQSLPGDKPHEQMAEHFERGQEPARALLAWRTAAEHAQARYANTQALEHAARGLALAGADEVPQRYALSLLRVQVLALVGDSQARVESLDALDLLVEQMAAGRADHRLGHAPRCEALQARAKWCIESGDALQALELARQAQALVPADAPQLAARAGRYVANALQLLGRHQAFEHCAQEVLSLARRTQDKGIEGAMLNALGLSADDRGDPAAAIGFYEQALACHRATGNQSHEADVLSNLGYVELGLGAYEQASLRFESVRAQYQRIGQREREASALLNLALAALHGGQAARAFTLTSQALPMLQAAGSRWLAAAALRIGGQASLAIGEHAAAVAQLHGAQQQFQSLGLVHMATEATASLALAQQASGDAVAALHSVDAVLAHLAAGLGLEGTEEPLRVYADCWQVLHAQADPRAAHCLRQGHELLQARAARVADAGRRQSFVQRVPHHAVLWHAATLAATPPA